MTFRSGPDLQRVEDGSGRALGGPVLPDRPADPAGSGRYPVRPGLAPEGINRSKMRPPILYQEGSQHRAQRRASARFFAPAVIEGYQPMIAGLCDTMLSPAARRQGGRLESAVDAAGRAGDWPGRRSDQLVGPRHE